MSAVIVLGIFTVALFVFAVSLTISISKNLRVATTSRSNV